MTFQRRANVLGYLIAFVLVLGVFACAVGGCAVSGYNKAVNLATTVESNWAEVDNQYQRRIDLVPNLVATVKGYAAHEEGIFTEIAKSRERYFNADKRGQKIEAAAGFERALSRLLMLKETYPELKAQASFQDLQAQLEGTENRIAVARKRYNDAVRALNTYCKSFFGRMFTGWAGVEQAEFFEADEAARTVPQVDFGDSE
jgi:LemA protein